MPERQKKKTDIWEFAKIKSLVFQRHGGRNRITTGKAWQASGSWNTQRTLMVIIIKKKNQPNEGMSRTLEWHLPTRKHWRLTQPWEGWPALLQNRSEMPLCGYSIMCATKWKMASIGENVEERWWRSHLAGENVKWCSNLRKQRDTFSENVKITIWSNPGIPLWDRCFKELKTLAMQKLSLTAQSRITHSN